MVTNLFLWFKLRSWCLPAETTWKKVEDPVLDVPKALCLVCCLVFLKTTEKQAENSAVNGLLQVKYSVFLVCHWTCLFGLNSKVGDPNKCYRSLYSFSQDHLSSLRKAQIFTFESNSKSSKCAVFLVSLKKPKDL